MSQPTTFICPNDKMTRIFFKDCVVVNDTVNNILTASYTCPRCRQHFDVQFNNANTLSIPTILSGLQVQPPFTRQGGV